ncbi:MAG: hypothetical protein Q9222_000883 [Ikaeria aurantiellina]
MKERITFIQPDDARPQVEQVELSKKALHVKSLKGAREQRLTFDLQEISQKLEDQAKTEVGIFSNGNSIEPGEIALGGILGVIGESDKPNPTHFSFPSRHHIAPDTSGSTFLATFPTPNGLHPMLRLTFSSSSDPPRASSCSLYSYLTLPSPLFIDKYQLSSPNLLASKNLHAIRALSGETDLEAPDWVVAKWGSIVLVELAPPVTDQARLNTQNSEWHADIPLHLRYLKPAAGGSSTINVQWPVVFWACVADDEMDLGGNPFDRVTLGYERLFHRQTMFYHFQPRPLRDGGELVEHMQVPVMDLEKTRWVEGGTIGVIMLGALWVVWKLVTVLNRNWSTGPKVVKEKKNQ